MERHCRQLVGSANQQTTKKEATPRVFQAHARFFTMKDKMDSTKNLQAWNRVTEAGSCLLRPLTWRGCLENLWAYRRRKANWAKAEVWRLMSKAHLSKARKRITFSPNRSFCTIQRSHEMVKNSGSRWQRIVFPRSSRMSIKRLSKLTEGTQAMGKIHMQC